MIRQELRKVIRSPFFYIAIFVECLLMLLAANEDFWASSDLGYLYLCSFGGGATALLPVLSGLAIADIYCIEKKSGYHYCMVTRKSKLSYCGSKVLAGILTGIMVTLFSSMAYIVICAVTHAGTVNIGNDIDIMYQNVAGWESIWIKSGHQEMILLYTIVKQCMYGSIWPVMALCVSVFINNRYVVIAAPLVIQKLWDAVMVGMYFYYASFNSISAMGRADLLPAGGLYFRIAVIVFLWTAEGGIFTAGVLKQLR